MFILKGSRSVSLGDTIRKPQTNKTTKTAIEAYLMEKVLIDSLLEKINEKAENIECKEKARWDEVEDLKAISGRLNEVLEKLG